jgi:hypothetical protein
MTAPPDLENPFAAMLIAMVVEHLRTATFRLIRSPVDMGDTA